MQDDSDLTQNIIASSVLLIRWLRAMDPSPALSGPQASALGVIITAGEITPSEIAILEEVKRPTIARTLGELMTLGLIERVPHPHDARSAIIKATHQGYVVFDKGRERRAEPLDAALAKLSQEEIESLKAGAAVMMRLLEANLQKSTQE